MVIYLILSLTYLHLQVGMCEEIFNFKNSFDTTDDEDLHFQLDQMVAKEKIHIPPTLVDQEEPQRFVPPTLVEAEDDENVPTNIHRKNNNLEKVISNDKYEDNMFLFLENKPEDKINLKKELPINNEIKNNDLINKISNLKYNPSKNKYPSTIFKINMNAMEENEKDENVTVNNSNKDPDIQIQIENDKPKVKNITIDLEVPEFPETLINGTKTIERDLDINLLNYTTNNSSGNKSVVISETDVSDEYYNSRMVTDDDAREENIGISVENEDLVDKDDLVVDDLPVDDLNDENQIGESFISEKEMEEILKLHKLDIEEAKEELETTTTTEAGYMTVIMEDIYNSNQKIKPINTNEYLIKNTTVTKLNESVRINNTTDEKSESQNKSPLKSGRLTQFKMSEMVNQSEIEQNSSNDTTLDSIKPELTISKAVKFSDKSHDKSLDKSHYKSNKGSNYEYEKESNNESDEDLKEEIYEDNYYDDESHEYHYAHGDSYEENYYRSGEIDKDGYDDDNNDEYYSNEYYNDEEDKEDDDYGYYEDEYDENDEDDDEVEKSIQKDLLENDEETTKNKDTKYQTSITKNENKTDVNQNSVYHTNQFHQNNDPKSKNSRKRRALEAYDYNDEELSDIYKEIYNSPMTPQYEKILLESLERMRTIVNKAGGLEELKRGNQVSHSIVKRQLKNGELCSTFSRRKRSTIKQDSEITKLHANALKNFDVYQRFLFRHTNYAKLRNRRAINKMGKRLENDNAGYRQLYNEYKTLCNFLSMAVFNK